MMMLIRTEVRDEREGEKVQTAEEIRAYIRDAILNALNTSARVPVTGGAKLELGDDDDLFAAGVDSLKAILIRGEVQKVRCSY